jgi:hypothetical protein
MCPAPARRANPTETLATRKKPEKLACARLRSRPPVDASHAVVAALIATSSMPDSAPITRRAANSITTDDVDPGRSVDSANRTSRGATVRSP